MHFDILSFLIGFGIAAASAFALFRMRRQITALRQTAESQAGSTRSFITNSAEARYYNDLVKTLNASHIASDLVNLTDIYVEPRFLRGLEPVEPDSEKKGSVFRIIPMLHDMPQSYASYNVETLTIHDLRAGETHLALLGLPGSGKSTALAIMGLFAANEIEFEEIDLNSDEFFEDETKNMLPDEKAKLLKQRQDTQQRAIEHLKRAQAKEEEAGHRHPLVNFQRLMPIMIHLRDIDLRLETFGVQIPAAVEGKPTKPVIKTLDPAEPLVKALQHRANAVTASTLPRMIYTRLAAGTCMVLIDGYDDIPVEDRPEKLLWLQHFVEAYGANFIIATGPVIGYDPLINLGLTPIFLRAWTDSDFERLIQRWAVAWPAIAGTPRKPAPMPEERIMRRVTTNSRGRLPLDITLKTWAAFSGDEQELGRHGWYDFYVRQHWEQKETRPVIERIAAEILNQGGKPLSRDRMKEFATEAFTGPDGKPTLNIDDFVNKLVGSSGLMIDWPNNTAGFTYALINAYLASETLTSTDPTKINAVATNPAWELAMPFVAAKIPVNDAVTMLLGSQPDLLYTSLFQLVSWLPDAPPSAPWRADLFKRLTSALLSPSQFMAIRERAMAALVGSRDKNVMFILRQALRSTDPDVRRLGCVGMGALGETDAIKDLEPMLKDASPDVQLSAGMALGAIGTEAALTAMLGGFVEGEQELRQAVAEALAAVPGEGHAVLRDAMTSQEMMLRRAAVFGLARIKAAWAISLLYRALLEDEQWYVRNAAEEAFLEAEGLEATGALRHPDADSLAWLIAWAAAKGEGVPAGPNARQVLVRVLQEGEEPTLRAAAAQSLANLGYMPALKPLYGALRDKDEKVRSAVYEALGELQNRIGEKFPAVV
ncbi:MAG: HEAT repeat domain-containing protein [Chloroflexota bacterium]